MVTNISILRSKNPVVCPLCASTETDTQLISAIHLTYRLCDLCNLIFMERQHLPERLAEKERYESHQNGPQYPGYVQFLQQAIQPTLPCLTQGMRGLDYGCGPGPTLPLLLADQNLQCDHYDPLFFPTIPEMKYDFIFATEVLEHFFVPAKEFDRIGELLKPGGILTIMTIRWDENTDFQQWYYAKDFTHVCFYHDKTFGYICEKYGYDSLPSGNPRVCLLKKNNPVGFN